MFEKGIRVYLFDRLACTPLVPFTIRHIHAVAGVMVTASHNPKEDNGYKVYWENGSQIIAPHDKGISKYIDSNLVPWTNPVTKQVIYNDETLTEANIRQNPLCFPNTTTEMIQTYIQAVSKELCHYPTENNDTSLPHVKVAYTAMHGVGKPFSTAAFEAFHLPPFILTPEQVEPDPTFPTVPFPNPEEGKGALLLAMATADKHDCNIILANDPDADRLAVAEWVPSSSTSMNSFKQRTSNDKGEWKIFTGNEIGSLLAYWCWLCYTEQQKKAGTTNSSSPPIIIASTVSSKFIGAMAAVEGFVFQETLTGFKWMGNAIATHEENQRKVLFSYEEAIGFCCGTVVRDKDGVSAAAVFTEMANYFARQGKTVTEQLEYLYQKYGYFISNNYYIFVDDPNKTTLIFNRLRNDGHYWAKLGDLHIRHIRDLTGKGWDSENFTNNCQPTLPTSSSTQMLTYKLSNGVVLTLRTSGTEPKLKYYCEGSGKDPISTKKEVDRTVELVINEMLQPEKYNLKRPNK